jgi:hypothetical protein
MTLDSDVEIMVRNEEKRYVLVRGTVNYYVGYLVKDSALGVFLQDAAWLLDVGKFKNFMTQGKIERFERFLGVDSSVFIPWNQICDISPWPHGPCQEEKC